MHTTIQTSSDAFAAETLTAFEPNGGRAAFLDQRMRRELADSLRYILGEAQDRLDIPDEGMRHFLRRLEGGPVSPLVFSFYCDAVLAIEKDDLAEAASLLREMIEFPAPHEGTVLMPLSDPREDAVSRRLVRFIDTDPTFKFEVYAPSPHAAASCERLIQAAFGLMDAGDPAQAAETRGLLREIVLAAGTLDPKAMTFDGASSFMLWGGIIINANQRDSELAMVQMLVHEGSHNLLFGLCANEPLIENADDELYASPLRKDPRPMDGIYHATFVTARMHRVVKRLLESGTLSGAMKEKAAQELADNTRLFTQGLETVRRHGRLTALGKNVMRGAEAYMAAES